MKFSALVRVVLLGTILVCAGGYLWFDHVASDVVGPADRDYARTSVQQEVLRAIRQAETIADPLERCLAYPNPVGYRWPREEIAAFCADEFTPALGWSEFKDAIEDGKAAKIDRRLDALLEGYFAGKVPEGAWMAAYSNNFSGTNALNLELVEQWINQSPGSAHALVARGMQEYAVAAAARGEKTIDETDPDALDRMSQANERARELLDKALTIDPRITPAYRVLIWIAKYESDEDLASRAMEAANRVDPANFYVRAAMMDTFEPRWGGSFEQMDQLAEDSGRFLARNPRIDNLRAMALAHRGLYLHFDKDYRGEMQEYEKGLTFGPVGFYFDLASGAATQLDDHLRAVEFTSQMLRFGPFNTDALGHRARELKKLGEDEWAMSDLERLLQIRPNDRDALGAYANSLIKAGKHAAAEARLKQLIAADPDDRWARLQLAWLYGFRLNRLDEANAMIGDMLAEAPEDGELWLQRIRLLESRPGPEMRTAVESFLKFADESSPEQMKAIPVARAWLASHPVH
ncbi:tetratricopeptide repeat protein [Dokdonella immobilis]|uniref:Tetratricopeptide repeat-containing protein n=1 Tax=Dokdonella immobilis TaxID=578942 RepID=A0A1I5AVZ9_9GAMM|nr:tetratricopeptide repeat protein [Dokdonella immobilis]SFN66399.1 Tetratricopeptide repeat-containing protein [Dokdonella immobilis]